MASILLRFPVAGSSEEVYDAVATEEGVSRWWSEKVSGPSGKGSELKVSFPDAPMTFDFDVTEDSRAERVGWRCTAGPQEWIGTDISFDVEPVGEGGVSVLFTHAGWKTTEESFPFIAYSWAQILPRLKQLAETGRPDPYFKF